MTVNVPARFKAANAYADPTSTANEPYRSVWHTLQEEWRRLLVTSGLGSARMDSCYRVIRKQRIERSHES